MKTLLWILLLGLCQGRLARAQFVDSFSDSNFTQNPSWWGDTAAFIINNAHQLQLQAPASSTRAQLQTPSQALHAAQWEWWMRLEFNPSSTNYADVYLVSDQANLDSNLNGYFVRIGHTPDEVSLYLQIGSTRTKIIDGRDGLLNRNLNSLKVRVERSATGEWSLWTDTTATGQQYELEGSTNDVQHPASSWFGLRLAFSSTRADKFFFDDFVVQGGPIPDTLAPWVVQAQLIENSAIRLKFSEWPVENELTNPQNYSLIGFGAPLRITPATDTAVLLEWASQFPSPSWLELDLRLPDSAGNLLDTTLQFLHRPIQPGDLRINEIMADPEPVVGLPNGEMIELYNATDYPIELRQWQLSDPGTSVTLPDFTLLAHGHVILCPRNQASSWAPFGPTLELHPWPSLNNDQDELRLLSADEKLIDSVYYQSGWHENLVKQQGGWTLERVSAAHECIDNSNWRSSTDPSGGTPGKVNSVAGTPVAPPPPSLALAVLLLGDTLLLEFSTAVLPGDLWIDEQLVNWTPLARLQKQWKIAWPQPAKPGVIWDLRLENWHDCHGQTLPPSSRKMASGRAARPKDLYFNEIYFRPANGGTSYFELYNPQNEAIDLSSLRIGAANSDWLPLQAIPLSDWPSVILPKQHLVFTRDTSLLQADFGPIPIQNRWQLNSWPTLNQSGGRLVLLDQAGQLIDRVLFHDSLHHPLLSDARGIALELPEGQPEQPFGSAQSNLRGSPGRPNTRQAPPPSPKNELLLTPNIIRPQALESMLIRYQTDEEVMVQIELRDAYGALLQILQPATWVTGPLEVVWEGTDAQGNLLPSGQYLIRLQYFDKKGSSGAHYARAIVNRIRP
jgi:hypothetical protein